MSPVWLGLLIRLLAAVLAGLTFGFGFGAAIGLAAAAGVLLLMLLVHSIQLARLQRWLKAPDGRALPEAGGAWGEVFIGLHRQQREARQAHARIEADLEVFSQAAEASPDGLVILDGDDRIVWCNRKAERHLGLNAARDIGIGIAAEHLPRLTERYYRIGRGRSRETGGIGLGLAIVKHILMCHQARLEIRSEAGAGSTFSAVFPVWRTTLPGGTVV